VLVFEQGLTVASRAGRKGAAAPGCEMRLKQQLHSAGDLQLISFRLYLTVYFFSI